MHDTRASPWDASILIVDDMPNNLRLLSQMLSEHGYRVRAVTSGQRALQAVRAATPDLILLDIRMPQMDGFAVCEQLKADPLTRHIPVIFISALDEIGDKVRAFAVGGVDYITKPFQLEEVLARVSTHLSLRHLQQQLEEANKRLRSELDLAGKLQAGILPRELPEVQGWQMAAALRPATETSGDFYDVRWLPHGQLMILIADVVDKGAAAALYMALCATLLRTCAEAHPAHPDLVLQAVNHRLCTEIECEEFVTTFYAVVDPASGMLLYANAGHNPPYLVRAGTREVQKLGATGMPMGIAEATSWTCAAVRLDPGDLLVLYTDGVPDAQNVHEEFFGTDRLLDCVTANAGRPASSAADAILATIGQWSADTEPFDDQALLVLSRDAAVATT
jgi:sigma-B regulation protein RsbU (phosphoserine phosphatase)